MESELLLHHEDEPELEQNLVNGEVHRAVGGGSKTMRSALFLQENVTKTLQPDGYDLNG